MNLNFIRDILQAEKLRLIKVRCLTYDASPLMWWDWNSIQLSLLPYNTTPEVPSQLYEVNPVFPSWN